MNLSFMLELSTKKCTGKKEKLAHCNILFARHNVFVHDFKGLNRKSLGFSVRDRCDRQQYCI